MKEVIFTGKCDGIGISHVARDCDFAEILKELFCNLHGVLQMDLKEQGIIEKNFKKMEEVLRQKKPYAAAEVKK